jgi:transcriptional regulator with XRE-family HTH domain
MGYRGKVEEQERARALRARDMTLQDIASELGVAKSSVSLWVRDVPFTPSKRRTGPHRRPHHAHEAKLAQIAALDEEGIQRVGTLTEDAFFVAGIALYAGEGSKADGAVKFANTDPANIRFFCAWLRRYCEVDERRLGVRVYLHQGLDLQAAQMYWSRVTGVPLAQFGRAYRAAADPSIRRNKHEFGCVYVCYTCSLTHRRIMGLVRALLSSNAIPG